MFDRAIRKNKWTESQCIWSNVHGRTSKMMVQQKLYVNVGSVLF